MRKQKKSRLFIVIGLGAMSIKDMEGFFKETTS
jgi:hypothetical protein